MATLWNLGSAQAEVQKLIDNVPISISGTDMYGIIERAISHIEQRTGYTIGSVSIDQKYHNSILYKTMYDVYGVLEVIGTDVSNVKLGDLSISKGGNSNISNSRISADKMLSEELRILGRRIKLFKANS